MKAETLWSLPSASVTLISTLLLLLASGAIQQAISIDSDPLAPTTSIKSESNSVAQSYRAPQMIKAASNAQQASGSPSANTTASTRKLVAPVPSSQRNLSQSNGRVRRPMQPTNQVPARAPPAPNPEESSAASIQSDALQDEIRRQIAEYSNTPPLFVTTTRDFFVDVARYPLGYKLATVQAIDSEGDRIEFSLKPANYRDASPYFSINPTSGELRLANRRIPLQAEGGAESTLVGGGGGGALARTGNDDDPDDDGELDRASESIANDADGGRRLGKSVAEQQEAAALERPSHLYFLNVAANDGKYTSIVELQIHVFNSTSFGTNSPVQLTAENGRRGIESAMRNKTHEFISKLYKPAVSDTNRQPINNSTLVLPSFVNPSLVPPVSMADDLTPYTTPASLELESNHVASGNQDLAALMAGAQRFGEQQDASRLPAMEPNVLQHSMMLNFVFMVCSCLALALLLLIFVVPLSVKRLKKRLKNMELQHEHLSQKASSAGSTIASSANSAGSTTTSGRLPSLSQFTLSGSDRSCAMSQMPDCSMEANNRTLGRQSSFDSAITSSGANFAGSSLSYQAQRYYPSQQQAVLAAGRQFNHHVIDKQQQQQQHLQHQQFLTNNGLNRINNGAIVNPVYLHGQSSAGKLGQEQQQQQQRYASELNNIYCPIDDDFYSTINTELEAASGMIVGQTCETRNYFASQCAPLEHHGQNELAISGGCDNGAQLHHRDTGTPESQASSRSSTRSLARFLSLPARHWSHQQQGPAEQELEARKRKSSFLDELECELSETSPHRRSAELNESPVASNVAKTIARANHIGQEQQVRLGKRARQQQQQGKEQWELERHQLRFIDILDEGQFGLVWRCKLRPLQQQQQQQLEPEQTVAVKTLKSLAARDERERQELLAEIEIMKLVCEHPNVVKMLHCCTRDISQSKPILLVMEHVELGKLQSFLEKSRASHNYATTSSLYNHAGESLRGQTEYLAGASSSLMDDHDDDDELASSLYEPTSGRLAGAVTRPRREQLTSRELIKFIYHVAKGMEYISGQCIVHRDLASRNILISAQRVCKIGDFGMARHVASSCDVYERRSRNTKIPVRWMAPEVLLHNSFTTKSDVYSFGILMWEIVTLGSTPYASLKMEDIIEAVARQGQRPSKPDYCHSLLYSIMSRCWSAQPQERPTFSELVRQLDELLLSANEYIELDQYPDHNYYNIAPAPGELV